MSTDRTDRELLEWAAKAIGIEFKWRDGDAKWSTDHVGPAGFIGGCWQVWNPLADDGDALRLAVKLEILVLTARGFSVANSFDSGGTVVRIEIEADPYAATRRAIVRAAAAIGKGEEA